MDLEQVQAEIVEKIAELKADVLEPLNYKLENKIVELEIEMQNQVKKTFKMELRSQLGKVDELFEEFLSYK